MTNAIRGQRAEVIRTDPSTIIAAVTAKPADPIKMLREAKQEVITKVAAMRQRHAGILQTIAREKREAELELDKAHRALSQAMGAA
jgi:hypothetical protein